MTPMEFTCGDSYLFASRSLDYTFDKVIITGSCRSGKTTLGNILATCKFVENSEEPWTAKILPILSGLKLVEKSVAMQLFNTFISELFHEMILLRTASFRPNDISSIWKQKSPEEIFWRMTQLSTRDDIESFLAEHKRLLVLNMPELLSFSDFLFESLDGLKLIHVIRDGRHVALDCLKKQWFSDDQLLNPIKPYPYSVYSDNSNKWHIPWWVTKGEEELFISYTEYDRCIYYWCQMVESASAVKNNTECMHTIIYDELISNPHRTLETIYEFLGVTPTPMTEMAISQLINRNQFKLTDESLTISLELKKRKSNLDQYIFG
jgi:hypothetical protein